MRGTKEVGISRDMRFVVETAIPAFCNERIRSAMLPPPVFTTVPSVSSWALGDLRRDWSARTNGNHSNLRIDTARHNFRGLA